VFRRRTSDDDSDNGSTAASSVSSGSGSTAVGADGTTRGAVSLSKGRPTPKRSEAEANRATRMNPPRDRRTALKVQRERAKADRSTARAALLSGDEKYLSARDRGPVRRFVRDFIDARRTIGEYFLVIGLVIVMVSLWPNPVVQNWAISAWFAVIVMIVAEAFFISYRLRRALASRFPEEKGPHEGRRGAVFYGIMRAFQLRRLRLPKPRVKPGATV